MKRLFLLLGAAFVISGCAPKMGQDIAIEMDSDVRFENSKTEIMMGVLSILGATNDRISLKIGGNLNIVNRWHSDLKVSSLEYALMDGKGKLAEGSAIIDAAHPFIVSPNTQKKLPLSLIVDSGSLNAKRILESIQSKGKITLKGEAVVQVWGREMHYPFERDARQLLEKVSHKALAI